jgi:hypothetical protein
MSGSDRGNDRASDRGVDHRPAAAPAPRADPGLAPKRRRRAWKRLLAALIGVLLAWLAGEFTLRFFLFSPSRFAVLHGKSLREANFYGDRHSDDEVWKLEWAMNDSGRLHDAPAPDRLLGWTVTVAPVTYAHPAAATVGERTPVLLYGDSFSQGLAGPEASFESILAGSDLARTHALLNYGAGGYGLDQTFMLVRATIDAWQDRRPIVLVGCFVDDDVDRCVLAFRSWPKPRFALAHGALVEPEPVETDIHAWLAAHPLAIRSYLWRFVKYRRHLLPLRVQRFLRGDETRRDEKQAVTRAILLALHRRLEDARVQHALVLFLGENGLERAPGCEWQEDFLIAACQKIGLACVTTRADLEAAVRANASGRQALFIQEGGARGHYSALGNRVAFEALRRAIEGKSDLGSSR